MSITIRDCLQLPSLSLGKVVAGFGGLDSIVTTISVLEFEDSDEVDIISPNELLISSLYCVKDDVDAQCKVLEKAKRSGDVGLVLFYADEILGAISPKLLKMADLMKFPIILMPESDMGLKYSDVISDVTEALFIDRNTNHYFVRDTIERLSQTKEKDRTPTLVLQLASSYAKAAFFLCDNRNNLIASSFWPLTNHLDFQKVISAYNGDAVGMHVFKTDFVDKKGAKLTLYASSQNEKLNKSIMAEVVEVIQLFTTLWNYNLNLQTPESVIPPLLEGDQDLLQHVCHHNKIDISHFNKISVLSGLEENPHVVQDFQNILKDHNLISIIDQYGQYTIFLYHQKNLVKGELLDDELRTYLSGLNQDICLTTMHSSNLVEEVPRFYQLLSQCLKITKVLYPKKTVFAYSDLLFTQKVLYLSTSLDQDSLYYLDLLNPIIEDSESDLLSTLLIYLLDSGSEVKATAEELYVHRNTVLYRLNKIRSLLNCDLNTMPQSYDIYLAAALKRLQLSLDHSKK